MKIKFPHTVIFVFAILLFTNCKKFGKTYDGYFYTNIENSEGSLFLYIDDKYKGELPNQKAKCSTENDTVLNQALHLLLQPGKYKIVGKDGQGDVKSSGILKFRFNSETGWSTKGGQETYLNSSTRSFAHKVYY